MKQMLFFCAILLLTCGCGTRSQLTTVHLVDVNGFNQTITQEQRLQQFERVNFLQDQPYQKVLRTWKDAKGETRSVLTGYYPSGRLMRYLEGRGGKAWGVYKEWHENGQLRVQVNVVAGKIDFGEIPEQTWVFDGMSEAHDEQGHLQAQIPYNHGLKEGVAKYYHPNGKLWQQLCYEEDIINGPFTSFYDNGQPLFVSHYSEGFLQGSSERYWQTSQVAAKETYDRGKLLEGQYYSLQGQLLCQVVQGNGERMVFGKQGPVERQTIKSGQVDGLVEFFDDEGLLWHQVHMHQNLKEGEEVYYYPLIAGTSRHQPKISLQWQQGLLHGLVRTWYPSGQLQSERQVIQEQADGSYMSYYPDGHVRMVEQYKAGRLVSGDYFEMGATLPISSVRDGNGRVMIYGDTGQLERESIYSDGEPAPTRSSNEI